MRAGFRVFCDLACGRWNNHMRVLFYPRVVYTAKRFISNKQALILRPPIISVLGTCNKFWNSNICSVEKYF